MNQYVQQKYIYLYIYKVLFPLSWMRQVIKWKEENLRVSFFNRDLLCLVLLSILLIHLLGYLLGHLLSY